jgi:hypothetical protein
MFGPPTLQTNLCIHLYMEVTWIFFWERKDPKFLSVSHRRLWPSQLGQVGDDGLQWWDSTERMAYLTALIALEVRVKPSMVVPAMEAEAGRALEPSSWASLGNIASLIGKKKKKKASSSSRPTTSQPASVVWGKVYRNWTQGFGVKPGFAIYWMYVLGKLLNFSVPQFPHL